MLLLKTLFFTIPLLLLLLIEELRCDCPAPVKVTWSAYIKDEDLKGDGRYEGLEEDGTKYSHEDAKQLLDLGTWRPEGKVILKPSGKKNNWPVVEKGGIYKLDECVNKGYKVALNSPRVITCTDNDWMINDKVLDLNKATEKFKCQQTCIQDSQQYGSGKWQDSKDWEQDPNIYALWKKKKCTDKGLAIYGNTGSKQPVVFDKKDDEEMPELVKAARLMLDHLFWTVVEIGKDDTKKCKDMDRNTVAVAESDKELVWATNLWHESNNKAIQNVDVKKAIEDVFKNGDHPIFKKLEKSIVFVAPDLKAGDSRNFFHAEMVILHHLQRHNPDEMPEIKMAVSKPPCCKCEERLKKDFEFDAKSLLLGSGGHCYYKGKQYGSKYSSGTKLANELSWYNPPPKIGEWEKTRETTQTTKFETGLKVEHLAKDEKDHTQ